MTDEDHGSFIGVEGAGDNRQVAEIDVVGGLVEDEEAGPEQDEAGEGNEALLAFGERADAGMDGVSADEEARGYGAQLGFDEPAFHGADDLLQRLVDRVIEVHHREVLAIVADANAFGDLGPLYAIHYLF